MGQDDTGPANYTEVMVMVIINDLDEPGKVTFLYLQPQEGAAWTAMVDDPDEDQSATYQWSVAEGFQACGQHDQHWINASGLTPNTMTYTPLITAPDPDRLPQPNQAVTGDKGEILRVKVTYSDRHGGDKVVYARTAVTVRGFVPLGDNKAPANPATGDGARTVNENSKVGQHVGNPVTEILDEEDQSLLTYTLAGQHPP